MQELIEFVNSIWANQGWEETILNKANQLIEKEKEQIEVAFSVGQEMPINHPTLPHYSREEYYNDNYNKNK